MNSIVDFKEHFPQGNNDRPVSETDLRELNSDHSFHLQLRNQDILKQFDTSLLVFSGIVTAIMLNLVNSVRDWSKQAN